METLQTLALAALMSLFEDFGTYDEVEDAVMKMEDGWKTWVLEEDMRKVWEKTRVKKKQRQFKDVHRQLVSMRALLLLRRSRTLAFTCRILL